jgi:hypothetical protein
LTEQNGAKTIFWQHLQLGPFTNNFNYSAHVVKVWFRLQGLQKQTKNDSHMKQSLEVLSAD